MATAVGLTAGALISFSADAAPASAAAPGRVAPAFSGLTSNGETLALSDLAGKTVVLE